MNTSSNIPDFDFKIGLAFSGGGYRAAAFSLGVLSYLNHLVINGSPLLKKVIALSTVSGGTITGSYYAYGINMGYDFKKIYDDLFKFMQNEDLINQALDNLEKFPIDHPKHTPSVIMSIADVYNKNLFNGGTFGKIMSDDTVHLKHISFNSTEFAHGLQFRFQWSEKIKNPDPGEPERGIIGNKKYPIPEEIAKNIRLGDILASSSCFPVGFEPINFPNDFNIEYNPSIQDSEDLPVGLMDGGIVDNQGITPLILAEERMAHNNPTNKEKNFDLLIISDVASPFMEGYKASEKPKVKFWKKFTLKGCFLVGLISLLIFGAFTYVNVNNGNQTLSLLFTILSTIALVLTFITGLIFIIIRNSDIPQFFRKPVSRILKLNFLTLESLLVNRVKSTMKMTSTVFLKRVRSLNYGVVYNNLEWKNRRMMNAIYELLEDDETLAKTGKLIPSKEMCNVTSTASNMGTTLWFTKEELEKKNMLNALIACGSFTICWNLLNYLNNIDGQSENLNANHKYLVSQKHLLEKHWNDFKTNPFWLNEKMSSS